MNILVVKNKNGREREEQVAEKKMYVQGCMNEFGDHNSQLQ